MSRCHPWRGGGGGWWGRNWSPASFLVFAPFAAAKGLLSLLLHVDIYSFPLNHSEPFVRKGNNAAYTDLKRNGGIWCTFMKMPVSKLWKCQRNTMHFAMYVLAYVIKIFTANHWTRGRVQTATLGTSFLSVVLWHYPFQYKYSAVPSFSCG